MRTRGCPCGETILCEPVCALCQAAQGNAHVKAAERGQHHTKDGGYAGPCTKRCTGFVSIQSPSAICGLIGCSLTSPHEHEVVA
jgi:hypothetical protein